MMDRRRKYLLFFYVFNIESKLELSLAKCISYIAFNRNSLLTASTAVFSSPFFYCIPVSVFVSHCTRN